MKLFSTDAITGELGLLYGLVAVIWIRGLWELYLFFRQWNLIKNTTTVPAVLAGILPTQSFLKAKKFNLDVFMFLMMITFFNILVQSTILLLQLLSVFWMWGISVAGVFGIQTSNEIMISIMFLEVKHTVDTLLMLPFRIFAKFFIIDRYDRNRESFGSFLTNNFVSYLIQGVGIIFIVIVIILVVRIGGQHFFLWLWLSQVIFAIFFLTIFMDLYISYIGNFRPLEDGELKESIKELASRVNFPLGQIYVYETRSLNASNAYFSGLCGSKQIVIYDTLMTLLSIREILAVIAHELGHWKHGHLLKLFILSEIYYFALFVGANFLFPLDIIYNAFNFFDSKPTIIGIIIIFDYVIVPFEYVFVFLITLTKRHFEYQADAFAAKLGLGQYLGSALILLYKDNLGFPIDDWLYSTFNHDHPSLLERLERLPK